MIDFTLMNKALKCAWVKRFKSTRKAAWRIIPDAATSQKGGFDFLLSCKCTSKDVNIKDLPPFYEKILQYWYELREAENTFQDNALKTVIWNNRDLIKVNNKTVFWRTWFDKNIICLDSLLDENLNFLTHETFLATYQIQTDFLTYYGLINAIPAETKKSIKKLKTQRNTSTQVFLDVKNFTTKAVYQKLVKHTFKDPTSKQRILDYGIESEQTTDYYKLAFTITKENN